MSSTKHSAKLKAIALKNTRSTLLAYAVPALVYSPMVVFADLTSASYWSFVFIYLIAASFILLNLAAIRLLPKVSYELGAPILYVQIVFFMVLFFFWIILLDRGRYGGLFFAITMLIYTYAYGSKLLAVSLNTSLIVVYLAASSYILMIQGALERLLFDVVTITAFLPASIVIGRAGSKLAIRKRKVKALLKEQKETQMQLQDALKKLEHAATTDELTGLINRREINNRLAYEYNQMRRNHSTMSILILDLDHFKNVNDTYGHPCGDAVLQTVARRLTSAFRETDSVSRWGGEEFIILMPDTNLHDALIVSKRALDAISATPITFQQQSLNITASGGLCEASNAKDMESALHCADEHLYEAKRQGRNQVVGPMECKPSKKVASN